LTAILRQELRNALRNRWLIGYAVLLAALGLVAAWAGLRSSEGMALATYGRTAATVTNLCLFLTPLASLILGSGAIAGERDRGTLEYLLAQPIDRRDLLLGKYLALLLALTAGTLIGFAPAAAVVALRAGWSVLAHFLIFPALAILLLATMLSIGLVLSVRAVSSVAAQGFAVFTWFAFVLAYDLVLLGVLAGAGIAPGALALLLVANPVDAGRVLVVLALEPDLYLLGPAGAWLLAKLGVAGATVLLVGSLIAWTGVALGVAAWSFRGPGPSRARAPRRLSRPAIDLCVSNTEPGES
jgi:ABC-type transport system involved in multi-copper enzyme maturation permease subunit